MNEWKQRRNRRNLALALTLLGLTIILYAVSFVNTQELEEQRHRENPQAHLLAPKAIP